MCGGGGDAQTEKYQDKQRDKRSLFCCVVLKRKKLWQIIQKKKIYQKNLLFLSEFGQQIHFVNKQIFL